MNDIEKRKPGELDARGRRIQNRADDVLALLIPMFAACYAVNVSEEKMAVFVDHVRDIPIDALRTAISRAIEECTFPPTIADIRERAGVQEPSRGKTFGEVDEERAGRGAIPDAEATLKMLGRLPVWPLPDTVLYRETKEDRMEQLRRYRREGDKF